MKGVMTIIGTNFTVTHEEFNDKIPLTELQHAVGGFIELVPFFESFDGEPCVAYCNEYGKLNSLPANRLATTMWYEQLMDNAKVTQDQLGDYLVGPVVVLTGDQEFMDAL